MRVPIAASAGEFHISAQEIFSNFIYEQEMHLAEREPASYITAVKELYGPEEALLSGREWLDKSDLTDCAPLSAGRDWRAVTIAVSVRLANRLNVAPDMNESRGRSS